MTNVTEQASPDAELVQRCLAGEQEAWAALVERYGRYVFAITGAYRLAPHDAEDVFQETFARLYEHLGRIRDPASLKAWIGQVTRRLCVDRIRRRGREEDDDTPDGRAAQDALAAIEEAMTVHQAMDGLPEHCREVLDRFFRRDQSYRDIGEALGIPPGTIASRISRCLARLKEALDE